MRQKTESTQQKRLIKDLKLAHCIVNGTIVAVISKWLKKRRSIKTLSSDTVLWKRAASEWHEQVAKAEAHLIKTQDPEKISYIDDEGHTDDIAGVSIHVKEFFDLAKQALAEAK